MGSAVVDSYVVLLPQFGISLVSWLQILFSINRFQGVRRFARSDLWALLLYMHAGMVRWVAALSLKTATLGFQILTAFVGATMAWASFVVLFNGGFYLPSSQQWLALSMSLLVTLLWEVNARVVNDLP